MKPKRKKKLQKPLAVRPEFEEVFRAANKANMKAVNAIRMVTADGLIKRFSRLSAEERSSRLTELALEHPKLIPVIKKAKDRLERRGKK
jgi:hypothetical protein